ncbi:MAG TPA: hypothetical protein VGM03_09075 [Phycisphaerae bacterium]|jgi:hypothetical protein
MANSSSRCLAIRRVALTVLSASLAGGCGYSTRRPFPDDIQTVAVEMLQSKEFRRELEFQLTEAIAKRIEMDAGYRIADISRADSLFSGEILEVRQRTLGEGFGTHLPREAAATIVLRYTWKDLRTGRVLVERPRFAFTTNYIPAVGETFQKGMVRGLDGAAQEIVQTMETGW